MAEKLSKVELETIYSDTLRLAEALFKTGLRPSMTIKETIREIYDGVREIREKAQEAD